MANNLNSMTTRELEKLANRNSADWHGADQATRDALHAENTAIRAILDARTGSSSTFDSGTGRWTVEPGTPTADALADEYRRVTADRSDAYEERSRAQDAAREAATQRAVDALERSRADAEARYSDLFRQLYVDRMKRLKNLDQRLASAGVTGGAAESATLGYDTSYEEALRQGELERGSALDAIDRAIADTRLTGDLAAADAAAKRMGEQLDAYADALKYLVNRRDSLDAQREKYAREDAALARRAVEQQRAAEEKAAKPTLTAAQVLAAIKAGSLTPAVLAAYEYYYGQAYR